MSYWSEVKEVALKGIDLALENIKETTEFAIEKGKDSVTYVQLKKDLFLAQRELHNLLADLGDAINEIYKKKGDVYSDNRVKEITDRVALAEEKCRGIEKQISDITKKA